MEIPFVRRPTLRSLPGLVLCVLLAAACDAGSTTPGGFCSAPNSLAIEATVTDSALGFGLADSARGTVRAGAYSDSLHREGGSLTMMFGGSQRGTYDVVISRAGYADWTRSGIAVTQQGRCGNVEPVQISARMVALP